MIWNSWNRLQCWVWLAWTRVRPLRAHGEAVRASAKALWVRARSLWGEQTYFEQFTLVALAALAAAVVFSSGWPSGGASRAALAIAGVGMVAFLIGIVGQASEEIVCNRRAARDWEGERAQLIEQNADLRCQIEESHRRALEIHDRVLRRVGVELHDGPAQLISLALLRLDGLDPERQPNGGAAHDDQERLRGDYERVRGALQEALAEIRCISAGLTLPELACVSPSEVLRLAVRNHERRTATSVKCDVDGLPEDVPPAIKSCLYRFAQEALNNAYRHAGGRGQTVRGQYTGNMIEIEVADAGPGFEPGDEVAGNRLGLLGMRERVASLGGTLEISSRPGSGTRLTTRFEMSEGPGFSSSQG
jgi:signal transduction histidine kinase